MKQAWLRAATLPVRVQWCHARRPRVLPILQLGCLRQAPRAAQPLRLRSCPTVRSGVWQNSGVRLRAQRKPLDRKLQLARKLAAKLRKLARQQGTRMCEAEPRAAQARTAAYLAMLLVVP